ncbi:sensor histidine kinase [Amphibiibacter pelophylacis]|uniref:PAS domain-containing protein n=1 Tax=Amphibiibacter pelophylacis TaxID=1799477 RepID=A0ACC6P4M7_9BURK
MPTTGPDKAAAAPAADIPGDMAQTRAILDSVFVGIVTVNSGGIEWMNGSAQRMFGGDLSRFAGQPISVVATPDPFHPLRREPQWFELGPGQNETFECRLKALDGREFWVVANIVATREGDVRKLTVAFLDIDSRRLAEQSIAQARSSLQRMVETAPMAIALFDARRFGLLQHNRMAALLLGRMLPGSGLTFREDDAVVLDGRQPGAELGPDILRCLQQAQNGSDGVWAELQRGQPPRHRVWDARFVLIPKADGLHDQILLVASDVTQQRIAEQARLDAAIGQREMLVKEVHHRIKNNLQGVAGLLQQSAQANPAAAAALSEAAGQVHAIAQVHGLQVGGEGPLRLWDVIQSIAGSVQRMFGRDIVCTLLEPSASDFMLPENESIPVALVLNELFTNAIKHSPASQPVHCHLDAWPPTGQAETGAGLRLAIVNTGQLRTGFDLHSVRTGVSGLSLVRALLPGRGAELSLTDADAAHVSATLLLSAPCVYRVSGAESPRSRP